MHDKYELGEVLGEGGEGVVRTGRNRLTQEAVAVKSIRKKRGGGRRQHESLKKEISLLAVCDHPNIVKLFEVCEDSSHIHLVQELLTGGDLFDMIISRSKKTVGGFTERDAKQVCSCVSLCVLCAYIYAH